MATNKNDYYLAVENGFSGTYEEYQQAKAATDVSAEVVARDAADQILQANIDSNKADITTNALNISTNAALIGTNAANISSNAAAIAANKAKLDSIETMESGELDSIVDAIFATD